MSKIIKVVFTDKKLNGFQVNQKKKYEYIVDEFPPIGALITGHSPERTYDTPMQIVDIYEGDEFATNGTALRHLTVDSVNYVEEPNVTTKEVKKIEKKMSKNEMFVGLVDKWKSQWIPEKEVGVKMSYDGTLCVVVDNEYVGMKADGTLTSYPREMLIDIPVYSINKPQASIQVGDVIKTGKGYAKVLAKNSDGSLRILAYTGDTYDKQEVQDFLLGQSMTRVIVNMFNFDGSGFNPLIFALTDESSDFNMEKLMMLSMLNPNGMNMSTNGMNPFMLMMLMKDGGNSDLTNLFIMQQMMGGNGMTGLFQTPVQQQKKSEASTLLENLKNNPELKSQLKAVLNAE